jgi:hypothetical protein
MFELVKAMYQMAKAESVKRHEGRADNFMDEALDITGGIVGAAIGIGLIAGGIFFTVNTTGWDTTSKLVWPYIFVLAIVALLFGLLYRARHS